ncbi:MAG TPA: response regulator transcription factor [Nitrospiria bacterium]
MRSRNEARVPFITSGKVATLLSTDSGTVYTTNISKTGVCFFSDTSLPVESRVILELELGNSEEPAAMEYLHGQILWKREWENLTAHGIHLANPLTNEKNPRLLQMISLTELPQIIGAAAPRDSKEDRGSLTHREWEITRLIAQGYNNKDMAKRLSISPKTVETHRANVYSKLKVHNAVQLIRALEASGAWVVNSDQ